MGFAGEPLRNVSRLEISKMHSLYETYCNGIVEAVHEEARHAYACQETLSKPHYSKLLRVQLQLIDEAQGEEPDNHQAKSNGQNVIMSSTIEEPADPH